MAPRIILLSGPISAGKSTLASALADRYRITHIKTRALLEQRFPKRRSRKSLQLAGRLLDRQTNERWVADDVFAASADSDAEAVVVDSVRTLGQVDAFREAFGARVVHVHLSARDEVLNERYPKRNGPLQEFSTYAEARRDAVERKVEGLAAIADIRVDTGRSTREDVLVRAAAQLGFYGRSYARLVDVLVGGQWGSEGKGHVASYLAPEYQFLVRVGGPNAGHKVFEPKGPFTFHQLPSGSRNSEARLLIAPGAVLRSSLLIDEINRAEIEHDRLSIDPRAMVIADEDVAFEEETLKKWIASTAQGVGAAAARRIMRGALAPGLEKPDSLAPVALAGNIPELKPWVRDTREILDDAFRQRAMVFIEGTQGTGLSILHGDYPHVTSRDTTVAGCLSEAGISASRLRKIVMVVRSYPIRVQDPDTEGYTSGPMGRPITWEEISERSGIALDELRRHEVTSTTGRKRRVAEFNWSLLRRSASINGPTDVALSFADYISIRNRDAQRFEQLTQETIQFIEEIERVTAAPVSLISTRFDRPYRSIIDRRAW
jgi:adenylosuccinate synthase